MLRRIKKRGSIGYFDELLASITIARDETLIPRKIRHYSHYTQEKPSDKSADNVLKDAKNNLK